MRPQAETLLQTLLGSILTAEGATASSYIGLSTDDIPKKRRKKLYSPGTQKVHKSTGRYIHVSCKVMYFGSVINNHTLTLTIILT